MSFAPGDTELVLALAEHKYLTAGQWARLTGRSSQLVRRRYRRELGVGETDDERIVLRMHGDRTEDAAYTLGPAGRRMVAEMRGCSEGELPFSQGRTVRSLLWHHTVLLNDVLIAFTLACAQEGSAVGMKRQMGEWYLANPKATDREKRFLLYERFTDGAREHFHRPDGALWLYAKASPEAVVICFVEADRATEPMHRIRSKFAAYFQLWLRHFKARPEPGKEYLGAVAMRVLFVLGNLGADRRRTSGGEPGGPRATRAKRIDSMLSELRAFERSLRSSPSTPDPAGSRFIRLFRFACAADLNEETALGAPIWFDVDGKVSPFFSPPKAEREREGEVAA